MIIVIIFHDKTRIWIRKVNIKRDSQSLFIAVQNNDIRTNYIKKNDRAQQNSKWWKKNKTIYNVVSKYSKLTQKEYKTRQGWVRNGIHKDPQ